MAGSLLSFTAYGQGITYVTNSGSLTVSGYVGDADHLEIPADANGLPVVEIGNRSFYSCSNLVSIVIPDSITEIAPSAFRKCRNLISVVVGSNVTNIEENAFADCSRLQGVYFEGDAPSFGELVFINSFRATVYYLPETIGWSNPVGGLYSEPWPYTYLNNQIDVAVAEYTGDGEIVPVPDFIDGLPVTTIRPSVFYESRNLMKVLISTNVTSIGAMAFAGCENLTEIRIPQSVTMIGWGAFANCPKLGSVSLGDGLQLLGESAFFYCPKLETISVDENNSAYSSAGGVLFNKDQTVLIRCPEGKVGAITVSDSTLSLADGAFRNCTNVTSLVVGDQLESLGSNTFAYCIRMSELYFKGDAPDPGLDAFLGATNSVIYYLPGTSGWTEFFGGRPTSLWLPRMGSLDYSHEGACFDLSWAEGMTVVVEACTNLTDGSWMPLQTNVLGADSAVFTDPRFSSYSGRFYRLRMP